MNILHSIINNLELLDDMAEMSSTYCVTRLYNRAYDGWCINDQFMYFSIIDAQLCVCGWLLQCYECSEEAKSII